MSDFASSKRLNEAFQYVEDELLDLVEQEKVKKKKRPLWTICGTVAACICLFVVLPVSAMVNNWFGIRDLFIPDPDHQYNLISLSGYQGSPEAEAHREWNEFLENYDTDHRILESLGNDLFIAEGREDWFLYSIYSYEMGEKLDEIAEKYRLKLHTEMNLIDQEELMSRVGGCFMDKEALTWAYMYEDGYFHVEGDVRLKELETVSFQFIRCVKGTFNEVVLRFDETDNYTEWQYLTPDGEPVLLVIAPDKALIFADYEDSVGRRPERGADGVVGDVIYDCHHVTYPGYDREKLKQLALELRNPIILSADDFTLVQGLSKTKEAILLQDYVQQHREFVEVMKRRKLDFIRIPRRKPMYVREDLVGLSNLPMGVVNALVQMEIPEVYVDGCDVAYPKEFRERMDAFWEERLYQGMTAEEKAELRQTFEGRDENRAMNYMLQIENDERRVLKNVSELSPELLNSGWSRRWIGNQF